MSNLHNEITYGTGPLRAIRLGTGMGEGDGVVRLGESFTPVVDWWERPDWAILAGDVLAFSFNVLAAVPAVRSMVALVNNVGSDQILIVEEICAPGSVLTLRQLAPAPVVGVGGWIAGGGQGQRDFRQVTVATRVLTNITVAVAGAGVYRLPLNQVTSLPIIVAPNTALILEPGADNTVLASAIAWRERKLLPGEPPSNR